MARSRFSLALYACLSLVTAIPLAVLGVVERAVAFVFALLPTSAAVPRLVFNVPGPMPVASFTRADPALLNSMRHEAGMRPLHT